MALVYIHRKLSDNTIFYVGIGQTKKRAFSERNRNRWWRFTVQKHGFYVEIYKDNISRDECCLIERYLINLYGRRDLKKGNLVNLTDGGDGNNGYKPTEDTKLKTSQTMKSKNIKRTEDEISRALATKAIKGTYKDMSRRVRSINIITNKSQDFDSITLASKTSGVPRSTIHNTLHNKTNKNGDKLFAGGYDWYYI